MRSTAMFTDGRIHVTLCSGTFDLAELSSSERSLVDWMVDLYRSGQSHGAFVASAATGRSATKWAEASRHPTVRAITGDLAARISLEEVGAIDLEFVTDMLPWRPIANRQRLVAVGARVSDY